MEEVQSPFFVIGSPRSGTTLLRLMLTSHPSLVIPPECGFVAWLHPAFGDWQLREFSNTAKVREFASAVMTSRKFETWTIGLEEIEHAIGECRPTNYAAACASIYGLFCARAGKPSAGWGDKNNFYLHHVSLLATIFPKARFIHIVRDGRDIACSYREVMAIDSVSAYRPELPVKISEIAERWKHDIKEIREQFATLGEAAVIQLRYEDLTLQPEKELSRICRFLGVAFAAEMLHFHAANRARALEPAVTMDWKQRTLEPVDPSTVGRHLELLTASEVAEFNSIAAAELRHYKYMDQAT